MRKLLLMTLLILCGQANALAQYANMSQFTTGNGLSNNSALCALRDSYGMLWVGTENGLNCFDGLRMRSYRDMVMGLNPIETNSVKSLYEYGDDIWLGGTSGLYVFDRKENRCKPFDVRTRYGVKISSTVPKILNTDNNLVWILTQGQGMFIYDTRADSLYQDSRHGNHFCDAAMGRDGLIYAVTLTGQLVVFRGDGKYVRTLEVPNYRVDKNPVSIVNANGTLWLGHNITLSRLTTGGIEPQAVFKQLGAIRCLSSDQQGRLLIGSDEGVFRYTASTNHLENVDQLFPGGAELTDNTVNNLVWDSDSTLIVLTHMGGVNMLPMQENGFTFIPLPSKAGSAHNFVKAMCWGADGELWLGSDGGLYRGNYRDRSFTPYAHDKMPYEVTTLMLDGRNLWIGTRHNGIRVLNTQTGAIKAYTFSANKPYTIQSNEINSFYRTKRGTIYVMTSWGLNRFDAKDEHFYGYPNLSAMSSFVGMLETSNGWLWASSSNRGLFCKRTENGLFDVFASKTLGQRTVVTMHQDRQGDFWVGTSGGGLYRYDSSQGDFERYDLEGSVLHDQAISFIEEDTHGALWLGTEAGIIRISPSRDIHDVQVYGRVQNFYIAQLRSSSFDRDFENVIIGDDGGVYSFNTNQLQPITDFQRVYLNDISFPFASDNEAERKRLGLEVLLYTREKIKLPYSDNSFTLHFASARYRSMPATRYEYMLEGFDKMWAHGTTTPEATYANLPPGDYTFLLRYVGQTDESKMARLHITILPPWYRTWLAYLCYILLLGVAGYYLYSRAQRRLKRRYQQQMQEFQMEQEKETIQSKIRFFIDLVHEIRTPLSLISLPLEQMENGELSETNRRHTKSIRRNMNYLLDITNELLDFQKQENGGITLVLRSVDLNRMLHDIYDQFKDAVEVQGKQLQLQLPEKPMVTSIDKDKMKKVMMNLVGNALKYTNKEIIIRLEEIADGRVRISVIDDGDGVSPEEKDKIFERYYQISNDRTEASFGTGLGLAYAKMLAEAHKGELHYEDAPGGGSCFVLTLPVVVSKQAEEQGTVGLADVKTETEAETPHQTSFRVLLVEDNEDLLKATSEALRSWYKVVKARDGVEALEILKYHEVDVIVSDVMMPRMDGTELCRRVKQNLEISHLPIILLTAKTTVEAKVEGMESGADVYLEKPFAIRQLHLQIENLLRLRQQFYERMRSFDGTSPVVQGESSLGLNQQNMEFIEQLQKSVKENMGEEDFSIDTLAEQLNMSRSSFYRKIKALTDMTPTEYLKTARMNQAAVLLKQGCRSTEVAQSVGFTSSSYFAKCFKAQFGCLPKDYAAN
ncbi:MAG: hybrid sensor histidine kinase/response regulator transcription factor [Prevotella sp.]|jgi:signal transduction histidine kinase/ligand-binding sensor domain-containing protein/DNA-binding response OmpR family regulator